MSKLEIPLIAYHDLLDLSAARHGDRDALRFDGGTLSFKDLQQKSHQMAQVLRGLGVRPRDRVALSLYNRPEYVFTFYAISRLGAVVVPLNASYKEAEARHILDDSGATLVVAADKMARQLEGIPQVVIRQDQIAALMAAASGDFIEPVDLNPSEDLVVLQYSSGTTGRSRGVMMSHRNLVASHLQYIHAGAVSDQDISILFVPFVHVYGLMLMGGAVASGATQVLMERYNLEASLELVQRHRVTLYYCTTAVVIDLVQSPASRRYDLTSLRYINSGGAPLPAEVGRMARKELKVAIANGYGMTEAPIVGHLVPGEERRIMDVDDESREVPLGQSGEICVKGPQVMKGYWNDPEATSRVLKDGWLRTGDVGFVDAKGRLIITARQKEMIKYKGFAVSPTELEGLLLEHPAVADCAVIGKAQADGNEIPKAFIVLKNGGSAHEAVQFVNGRIAEYKRIRESEVISSIPRNDAGKILKRLLA